MGPRRTFSNASPKRISKVINLPDTISDAKIEEILEEKFKMNDCSWMSYDDPSTYFYHFHNGKLIYEGI